MCLSFDTAPFSMRKGKIPEDYTFCEEWSFYIPFLTDI